MSPTSSRRGGVAYLTPLLPVCKLPTYPEVTRRAAEKDSFIAVLWEELVQTPNGSLWDLLPFWQMLVTSGALLPAVAPPPQPPPCCCNCSSNHVRKKQTVSEHLNSPSQPKEENPRGHGKAFLSCLSCIPATSTPKGLGSFICVRYTGSWDQQDGLSPCLPAAHCLLWGRDKMSKGAQRVS